MKEKKKCDKLHVKKKGYNSSFMTVQVITQNQIVIVEAKLLLCNCSTKSYLKVAVGN